MSIIEVVIAHCVVTHEGLEGRLRTLHRTLREVGISQAIVCKVVLRLALWRTTDIILKALLRKLDITLLVGHLTLPIERQGVILWHKTNLLCLLKKLLGILPAHLVYSLHSAEHRNLLQHGTKVIIGIWNLVDSRICSIVIL